MITLDVFLDCSGVPLIPQTINITSDCGFQPDPVVIAPPAPVEVSQLCPAALPSSSCSGGPYAGIHHYQLQTIQTLPPCDSWHFTWEICCRNTTQNLQGTQGMYVEGVMNNLVSGCNDSPQFPDQTLQYVCVNQPVYYNPGANDPDGDHLVYSLIGARRVVGGVVGPVLYQPGFTGAVPVPGITLDPATGQLVFTPTAIANYVIVIQVEEYDAAGNLIGTVMRDMIFVVRACAAGSSPTVNGGVVVHDPADPGGGGGGGTVGVATGINSVMVCQGVPFCVDVTFEDSDPGTVLQLTSEAASLLPGSTFTVTGTNPAVGTICWTPDGVLSPVNVLVFAHDGSCPVQNSASVAVNITTSTLGAPPDPGTNAAVQLCAGGSPVDLFLQLGGSPDPGGWWTTPAGTVHNGSFNPLTDVGGIYTYHVLNACTGATSTAMVTVTVGGGASAGTSGTLTLCSNGAPVPLVSGLGGTPQPGGTWTGPGTVAHGPNYAPITDVPGIYTYTVPALPGCPGATATVAVAEVVAPNAGANGTVTLCENSVGIALFGQLMGFPQAGGTWTGPGGVPFAGTYDPAVHGPGIHTYTVAGTAPCAAAVATVTVNEIPSPNAGINAVLNVCHGGGPVSLFAALGGAPATGGTWTTASGIGHGSFYDPATDVPGAFFYTVMGAPPCANATASVTVSESAAGLAGADAALALCSSDAPLNLFAQLPGADPGGAWVAPDGSPHGGMIDPAVDGPGVYRYQLPAVGGCPGDEAELTVTIDQVPDAGAGGVVGLCSSDPPLALFSVLTGADAGGTWTSPGGAGHSGLLDPSVGAPGIYTYTLPGVGACAGDQAQVTATIQAAPNAGGDGAVALCSTDGPVDLLLELVGAGPGGNWTAPGGGAHSGLFDPAVDGSGTYLYTLAAVGPCPADQSQVVVTRTTAPNAGADGLLDVCATAAPSSLFPQLGGAMAGGTWSAPGGAAHSGLLDPMNDAPGTYTYSLPGVGACAGDQAQVAVTIHLAPEAGTGGAIALCDQGAAVALATLLTGADAGGTWSAPGGSPHSGLLDPSVDAPGTYLYALSAQGTCPGDQAPVQVTIDAAPQAGTDGFVDLCSSDPPQGLWGELTASTPGGTWIAPGGAPHSGLLDPAVDPAGSYTYQLPLVGACPGDQASVLVSLSTAREAGIGTALTLCSSGPVADLEGQLVGADAGGAWSAPGGAAHTGLLDPATALAGTYTYALPPVGACPGDQSQVAVTINLAPNAGGDATWHACSTDPTTNLFVALVAPAGGGTWSAPDGSAHSGVLDPATDAPGLYTYTVLGGSVCPADQAQVAVTIGAVPQAGGDGLIALCSSDAPVGLFAQLTGATPGGTWTAPGGATHSGTVDPATSASGVYLYALPGSGGCPGDQSQVVVTIVQAPEAGGDIGLSLCSTDAPINLFTQLTGADAGGTWTAPGGAPHNGTLDPATGASGVYVYTLAGSGSCLGDQSQVTVQINAAPNAGGDGALTLCATGSAQNLFPQLVNASAGGSWTAPGGVPHSGTYDPVVDAPGIYTYTVTGIAPCVSDQAIVTVQETTAPNAGADGSITLCSTDAPVNLFTQLTGADAGGSWTGPGGAPHNGTLDPATGASGVYVYTLAGSGSCLGDQSQVTVQINTAPNAGGDGALTLCATGAAQNLFPQLVGSSAGGSWTAPGGAPHSGTYDPVVDAPGIYTYTITGIAPCVSDQAIVTVQETAAPNAGADGSIMLCSTDAPINLFTQLTGADAGGTWTAPGGAPHNGTLDPATGASGVYVYTLAGSGSCLGDQSQVTVQINAAPNAGGDGALTLCATGSAQNLFPQLVNASAGGSWTAPGGVPHSGTYDPMVDAPGVYTYTITGIAPCVSDQAIVTVQETTAPNAGADGSITLCSSDAAINLLTQLTGADAGGTWSAPGGAPHNGTLDPATAASGVYVYTLAGSGSCLGDQSQVTVQINTAPNAGGDGALTLCATGAAQNLFPQLVGASTGGSWTAPGGAPHSGTYDPVVDAPGVYNYTISGVAPCVADQAIVTVQETAAPNAGADGSITLCSTDAPINLFTQLTGADAGGTWTAPGGAPHNDMLDPATAASGVYVYTLAGSGSCLGDQSQVTVQINAAPNAGGDGALTLCAAGASQNLFPQLVGSSAGGSWTAPGGAPHSGTYDPVVDAPGIYTYTITGIAPCVSDQAIVTVQETAAPNAGADGSITLCSTDAPINLFTQLTGADAGGTWSAPGGVPHNGALDPATAASGTYLYTLLGDGICPNDASSVIVSISAAPQAGTSAVLEVCTAEGPVDLFALLGGTPDAGGEWSDAAGGAMPAVFLPGSDPSGVYTYTVEGGGCADVTSFVDITVLPGPDAGGNGILAVCDDMATVDLLEALSGSPDDNGTWTSPTGTPFSGVLDPASAVGGVYTYLVPGNIACPQATATVTVSVSEAVSAGTIGIVTLCSSDPPVALFGALGGAPDVGGTWTDAAGSPVPSMFDPANGIPGVFNYTVPASAPCVAVSSSVTVEVDPAPQAGTDAAVTWCSTGGPMELVSGLGGSPDAGGVWTNTAGVVVPSTFDPANDPPGVYRYTVSGPGACSDAQATLTVSVVQPVDAGVGGSVTVCADATPLDLTAWLSGTPDAGGTWYAPNGAPVGPVLDPGNALSGTYRYVVDAPVPCPDAEAQVQVTIVPLPQVVISVEASGGCAPVTAVFSTDIEGEATYAWDFGAAGTSELPAPVVVFEDAGTYTVQLTVNTGGVCSGHATSVDLVQVFDAPVAAFEIVPPSVTGNGVIVQLMDRSIGATSWSWDLAGTGTTTVQHPLAYFPDLTSGVQEICLVAYVSPTCADTMCQELVLPEAMQITVPNAFTPDGDGVNDGFMPVLGGVSPDDYEFMIFDRWGAPLYRSARPGEAWDGRSLGGDDVPLGVYLWRLVARDGRSGQRVERIGHVTLVR